MKRISKNKTFKSKGALIFYIAMVALPTLQFLIFYLGVNVNTIVLSFTKYGPDGEASFALFENFTKVFESFTSEPKLEPAIKNSLLLYACTLFITFASLVFSFYIYKRHKASGFFRFVLFLPNIISSIILVLIFKYFCETAIPKLGFTDYGLIANPETNLAAILFYNVWAGFGTQVMMYSGSMTGIPVSVSEAAQLDGITPFKEFIHITVPCIWGTVSTFLVVCLAEIFTNNMGLVSFFGLGADSHLYTIGYYLYREMWLATKGGIVKSENLPFLAAMGLVFSLIAILLTTVARYLLKKFGPKAD